MIAVRVSTIHITGASGCGVTTLGRALAGAVGSVHIDADDVLWLPTDPPYTSKRDRADRIQILEERMGACGDRGCVLSGSILDWGDSLIPLFRLVVFLTALTSVRLQRLKTREAQRFGPRIAPGGDLYEIHRAFLEWAAAYDAETCKGRTRRRHEEWLARIEAPVLRLDGVTPTQELVCDVFKHLQTTH
jgi:adenylate kinase family enzyme